MTERRRTAPVPHYSEVERGTKTEGIPLGDVFKAADTKSEADKDREERRRLVRIGACLVLGVVAIVSVLIAILLDAPGQFAMFGIGSVVAGVCAAGVAFAR